jgi:hypothetical protein
MDHQSFREHAFVLMATSAYIAAGKVYHIASKIHGAYMRKEYKEELSYYPLLIEESLAFKAEMKKALANKKGKRITEASSIPRRITRPHQLPRAGR